MTLEHALDEALADRYPEEAEPTDEEVEADASPDVVFTGDRGLEKLLSMFKSGSVGDCISWTVERGFISEIITFITYKC